VYFASAILTNLTAAKLGPTSRSKLDKLAQRIGGESGGGRVHYPEDIAQGQKLGDRGCAACWSIERRPKTPALNWLFSQARSEWA
jgi:hypothetical protein